MSYVIHYYDGIWGNMDMLKMDELQISIRIGDYACFVPIFLVTLLEGACGDLTFWADLCCTRNVFTTLAVAKLF